MHLKVLTFIPKLIREISYISSHELSVASAEHVNAAGNEKYPFVIQLLVFCGMKFIWTCQGQFHRAALVCDLVSASSPVLVHWQLCLAPISTPSMRFHAPGLSFVSTHYWWSWGSPHIALICYSSSACSEWSVPPHWRHCDLDRFQQPATHTSGSYLLDAQTKV